MHFNPLHCVESGELRSFIGGRDARDAAMNFIMKVHHIKGVTVGEDVVVKDDYEGKTEAAFKLQDLLVPFSSYRDYKIRREGDRIRFTMARGARFEFWQGVYRIDEPLMSLGNGRWIASGITKSPATGEML